MYSTLMRSCLVAKNFAKLNCLIRPFATNPTKYDLNEKTVEHLRDYTFQHDLVGYVKEAQKRSKDQNDYMKKVVDNAKNPSKTEEKTEEVTPVSKTYINNKSKYVSPSTNKITMLDHNKCLLCQLPNYEVSYLNQSLLCYFISQSGRIYSHHETHTCAKHQRKISRCIKQARQACIIPFMPDFGEHPEEELTQTPEQTK
ncbi:hypothetical protein WA158_007216 [Blastocystis sp. Blastoise]